MCRNIAKPKKGRKKKVDREEKKGSRVGGWWLCGGAVWYMIPGMIQQDATIPVPVRW